MFIVSKGKDQAKKAKTVMTGSTNFSVTGMYVNSNHVLIFNDAKVAGTYLALFNEAWEDGVKAGKFNKTDLSTKDFAFKGDNIPKMSISFAPHSEDRAREVLKGVSDRIKKEAKNKGNVLFAVMNVDGSDSTSIRRSAPSTKTRLFTVTASPIPPRESPCTNPARTAVSW